jgi:hypothetical protein
VILRSTKRAVETRMTTAMTTRGSVDDTVSDLDLGVRIVVTRRIGIRVVKEIAGAEVEVATEISLGIDRQRRTIAITTIVAKDATRTGENGVGVAVAIAIVIKMTTVAETVTTTVAGENDRTTGTIVIRNQSASWMSESAHQITTVMTADHKTRPHVILSLGSTSTSTSSTNISRTTSSRSNSIISARITPLTTRAKERNRALDCRDRIIPQVQHHPLYEFNPLIWVPTKTCFGKSERNGIPNVES